MSKVITFIATLTQINTEKTWDLPWQWPIHACVICPDKDGHIRAVISAREMQQQQLTTPTKIFVVRCQSVLRHYFCFHKYKKILKKLYFGDF